MNDLEIFFDIINLIKTGSIQKVKDIIDEFGLSFCPLLDDGYPLLAAAVGKDQVEMVSYLLQNNAKVNSDRDVLSPLHIAAINNNTTSFKVLLERGATIIYNNIYKNKSPIKSAVEHNNIEIARLIVKHNNFGKKYNELLLRTAVKNNSLEMVLLLLETGADVNEYDDDGSAPIHHAVVVGNNDILQLLLEYGADVNAKNKFGDTPVFLFIQIGSIVSDMIVNFLPRSYFDERNRTFSILLDNDADINVLNVKKNLPHDVAVNGRRRDYSFHNGNPEKIKCLIKQIVKLKSRYAPLSRNYDNLLSSLVKYLPNENYKKMCEQEITRIIAEKIPNSGISFHNILCKNSNFLAAYAKNINHETFILSDEISRRFPVYGSVIKLRFSKGLTRKNLLEKSVKIFHNLFPVASNLLSYGVDDVFKCLDNNDLRHFLRMFQQDNKL